MLVHLLALVFLCVPSGSAGNTPDALASAFLAPFVLHPVTAPVGFLALGLSLAVGQLYGLCTGRGTPSSCLRRIADWARSPEALNSGPRQDLRPLLSEPDSGASVLPPAPVPQKYDNVAVVVTSFANYCAPKSADVPTLLQDMMTLPRAELSRQLDEGFLRVHATTDLECKNYLQAWLRSIPPDAPVDALRFTCQLRLPQDILATVFVQYKGQPHYGLLRPAASGPDSPSYFLELLPLRSQPFEALTEGWGQKSRGFIRGSRNDLPSRHYDYANKLRSCHALIPELNANTFRCRMHQVVLRCLQDCVQSLAFATAFQEPAQHLPHFQGLAQDLANSDLQIPPDVLQDRRYQRVLRFATAFKELALNPSLDSDPNSGLCPVCWVLSSIGMLNRIEPDIRQGTSFFSGRSYAMNFCSYFIPLSSELGSSWAAMGHSLERQQPYPPFPFHQRSLIVPYFALIDPTAEAVESQQKGYLQMLGLNGESVFVQGPLLSGQLMLSDLKLFKRVQPAARPFDDLLIPKYQSFLPRLRAILLHERRLLTAADSSYNTSTVEGRKALWQLLECLQRGCITILSPREDLIDRVLTDYTADELDQLCAGSSLFTVDRSAAVSLDGVFQFFLRSKPD
jgi:hypothetical protein